MIGTPGRRHLGTVMDELAVVEPHGPDRLVAVGVAAAQRRARRDRRPRPAQRRAPRSAVLVRDGGQLTVVACMPEAANLSLRSRRLRRPLDRRERNRTTVHRLLERGSGPMAAPRASIAVSVTRAGLTLATAFALTRVFAGRSWLFVMVIAAVVPPAAASSWAQRRHWHALVRLAVVAVVGVWLAGARRRPDDHGRRASRPRATVVVARARARRTRRTRSAPRSCPSSPVGAALVLAFVGVFVAAALTYWIATSLDAPFGAFAPSVALFIVVAAMGSGGWVAPTALYALASLAYLLALAQHDLVDPPHVVPREPSPRGSRIAAGGALVGRDRGRGVAGRSGRRCRARAAARSSTTGRSAAATARATCSRLRRRSCSIQRQAHARTDAGAVHRQVARAPAYWRVIALDWFTDDNAWGVNKATEQPRVEAHDARRPPAVDPAPPAVPHRAARPALAAGRVPARSASTSRPRASCPTRSPCSSTRRAGLHGPRSTTSTPRSRRPRRRSSSRAADSTRAPMRAGPRAPRRLPARAYARSPARSPRTRTRRTTQAVALEKFFREPARSSTRSTPISATPPTRSRSSCSTPRAGFCEQFAASFAAMARAVGVPARVAVGYQPGHARRRRPLPRDQPQRARLARGVDRGRGVDPVRADARASTSRRSGIGTGGPQRSSRRRHPATTPPRRRRRRRRRPVAPTFARDRPATRCSTAAGRRTRRTTACATSARSSASRSRSRVALGVLGILRASCRSRSGAAAGGGGTTTIRGGACSARGPRPSTSSASPVSRRGRRRRRWSSRCATRPRTARATPGPR